MHRFGNVWRAEVQDDCLGALRLTHKRSFSFAGSGDTPSNGLWLEVEVNKPRTSKLCFDMQLLQGELFQDASSQLAGICFPFLC
jgi:hypothetical protein